MAPYVGLPPVSLRRPGSRQQPLSVFSPEDVLCDLPRRPGSRQQQPLSHFSPDEKLSRVSSPASPHSSTRGLFLEGLDDRPSSSGGGWIGQAFSGVKRASTPQQRASTPQQRAVTPQLRASTPQQRASTPQQRASTPQPRDSTPQPRASTPQQRASPKLLDDGELRAKVFLGRIKRSLAMRRRHWFSFLASFDTIHDGLLEEEDFDAAVRTMGACLSDQEIREVRSFVQGMSDAVSIDHFGALLQQAVPPEVSRMETWGRSLLAGLAREAGRAKGGDGLGPGAIVRVHDLQSESGQKLNGSEGMVDKWDATSSRWVVWMSTADLKSVRPENLQVVRPGTPAPGSAAGVANTVAFYKQLCKGGETTVSDKCFLSSIKELRNLDDSECRRLLLLLPKSKDGMVDVPEVLSQLVASPAGDGGFQFRNQGQQPRSLGGTARSICSEISSINMGETLPGSVPSPRDHVPSSGSAATAPGIGGAPGRCLMQAVLHRLGRRLSCRSATKGPGTSVLRLFTASSDVIKLEELLEAVRTLPLGISVAEAQGIFDYMRDNAGPTAQHYCDGAMPLAQLESVIEAAHAAGQPPEVAQLANVDLAPLGKVLQKLGFLAHGPQVPRAEFRSAVEKAVPWLSSEQLELLETMTDKDADGSLLPLTLLAILRADGGPAVRLRAKVPELLMSKASRKAEPADILAPAMPRLLVADVILVRLRDRLLAAGLQGKLPELVGLFVAPGSEATVRRNAFVAILSQFRLGLSCPEIEELVGSLCGTKASAGDVKVSLGDFFTAVARPVLPEDMLPVAQLRSWARQRLEGRGAALAAQATALKKGQWIPEKDFRRCLISTLSKKGSKVSCSDEDKLVLLAEKSTAGEIRWQGFVQTYAGGVRNVQKAWGNEEAAGNRAGDSSPVRERGKSSPLKRGFWQLISRKSPYKEVSI